MEKNKIALVIGRFQPLHKGHIFLLKQALAVANNIIIGIGSANVRDYDNPFSLRERRKMLERALEKEKLKPQVLKIVTLDDYHNDAFWLTETLKKTGTIDIVVGNNDWVNNIFVKEGYQTLHIPYYKREIYEGKKIREKMRRLHQLPEVEYDV